MDKMTLALRFGAAGANTLLKSGIAAFVGTPQLRRLILGATALLALPGAGLLLLA